MKAPKNDPFEAHNKLLDVERAAKKLEKNPSWRTKSASTKHLQNLRARDAKLSNDKLYADTHFCAECKAARDESGDSTSLCDQHLRKAMGML
ncbi:MAG: hypothetical protein ACOX8U_11395 [Bradymonadia bacterium]|jgi:hypothetical protein